MIRVVLYLVGVAAVATGMSWLADRPGNMVINWQGYEVETTVFRAVVLLALLLAFAVFAWSLLRSIWSSPAMLGHFFTRRRQERGLDALSSGMIAIGAGDRTLATRYAVQARKALPNEPLTQLLRAQAAQLSGDRSTSRRIFEAMLGQPDTEQLGLRGLFLEAEREGEAEAARQFAERALRLNPRLGWPVEALFELQCREGRWDDALETLATAKKYGHLDKAVADRRRAVLLTARAQELEDTNGAKALELAAEAHNLAPALIPAAAIAGRQHAARSSTAKVAKVIERTWKLAQHPELALVYAYARPGDSPRDRLERVRRLSRLASHAPEAQIALATAAIEAREWGEARKALEPLLEEGLSQRVCTLMARIEGEENNDAGRVREWLGRAADAPRDPAWTADGVVSERWMPVSPVTGALDAFEWKVPPETQVESDAALALKKIEELVLLGTRPGGPEKDAESKSHGLRVRTPDPDRPITVEVEPVTREGGARDDQASTATQSGVPVHPPRRSAVIPASRETVSDAVV
ncbi:MAG: heme biosynthesis HemY N-terminal domain-containing protein, partial [Hyphomicrobiaceae bacterium]